MNEVTNELELTLGGTTFRCKFGIRAIGVAQEVLRRDGFTETTPEQINRALNEQRLVYWAAVVYGALRKHHPAVSLAEVDGLLESMTEAEAKTLLVGFGFAITPDPKDVQALELERPAKDPPAAQGTKAGTGARSSSRRAASA